MVYGVENVSSCSVTATENEEINLSIPYYCNYFFCVLGACFFLSSSDGVVFETEPLGFIFAHESRADDESESLPYEMTPTLSGDLVQESGSVLQIGSIVPTDPLSTPRRALSQAKREDLASRQISDLLIIIDHSFRC